MDAVSCSAAPATVWATLSACAGGGGRVLGRGAGTGGGYAHGIGGCRHRCGPIADLPQRRIRRGFDGLRHADQRRPLLRLGATALGLLLGGDLLAPDHVFFEHEHGTGHVAEFVTMVLSADRGRHVSGGKLGHCPGQRANRPADRRDDHRQEDQHDQPRAADDPIGAYQHRVRAVAGDLDGSRLGGAVFGRQTGDVAAQRLERRIAAAEIAHRDRRVRDQVQRVTQLLGIFR